MIRFRQLVASDVNERNTPTKRMAANMQFVRLNIHVGKDVNLFSKNVVAIDVNVFVDVGSRDVLASPNAYGFRL